MTDRELLELAAKAAGIAGSFVEDFDGGYCYQGETWGILIVGVDGNSKIWHPLTDDGDALRLAVKLGIDINHDMKLGVEMVYAAAQRTLWSQAAEEKKGNDPHAATRRAIVKAAAEIGRKMT